MSKNILSYKKGDILTRVENAKVKTLQYNENLGIDVEVTLREDNSLRGVPLEFIGTGNNLIYFKGVSGILKDITINCELDKGWEEGWDYYEDITEELKQEKERSKILDNQFKTMFDSPMKNPYSFKKSKNFIFIKKYDFYFQDRKITELYLSSEKKAKLQCDILNGAYIAGSLGNFFNLTNKVGA
jgi:hypothetical protein